MKEKIHFVFLQRICFKYNNKPSHWVGHSKLRSLEIDEFFKITPNFDGKDPSVTGIREEEKSTDKKTSNDDDTNAGDTEKFIKIRENLLQ